MYHNANQYAKYLTFVYAVFLLASRKSFFFKIIMSTIVLISILYTR